MSEQYVFDVECYKNFFLILFKRISDGKVIRFEISEGKKLDFAGLNEMMRGNLLIGFNSKAYDIPMVQLALMGYTVGQLKDATNQLINDDKTQKMSLFEFSKLHKIQPHSYNHIDLIEVAPLDASLKIYAGRLHCKKMQDLPYNPHLELTRDQMDFVTKYCENDLENTMLLYDELSEQIKLREELSAEYRQDLRSRSDAQIAEYVIAAEVEKINDVAPKRPSIPTGTAFKYNVPSYIAYDSPILNNLLERVRAADFVVSEKGGIDIPYELDELEIRLNGNKYQIGIGGLHSTESCINLKSDDEYVLIDRDVTSYYPSIILTLGFYPKHLGRSFLTIYGKIFNERLAAKKKASQLKEKLKQLKNELKEIENAEKEQNVS